MKDRLVTIVLSVAATYGLMKSGPEPAKELEVDRLIVRKELIVSDTGMPWEKGYEAHQIPRGVYARSLGDGPGGLWVRSRLIKGEIDDPFDDRFHALERDGSLRRAPGHISWNVWLDGAWRQMAIIQGEGLELSEVPRERWSGLTHPGRLRFQTFRPGHGEPLTDALIGQGMMSRRRRGIRRGRPALSLRSPATLGRRDRSRRRFPPRRRRPWSRTTARGEHQYAIIAVGAAGSSHESLPGQPVPGTRDTSVGQRPGRGLLRRRP